MADTIIVRCPKCGTKVGEITFVPGSQQVGCPNCGFKIDVIIYKDGTVKIY